jgi:mono/diheme cytochrome c family protein
MAKFKRIAVTALAVAALGIAASAVAQAQDNPPGDAANGKRIYLKDGCFTCHGRVGQGGSYSGPAPILAHTALPFEAFKGQIRNPVNDMPAFSATILSDKDITDIYAFVESLPGPSSPKNYPILNN